MKQGCREFRCFLQRDAVVLRNGSTGHKRRLPLEHTHAGEKSYRYVSVPVVRLKTTSQHDDEFKKRIRQLPANINISHDEASDYHTSGVAPQHDLELRSRRPFRDETRSKRIRPWAGNQR
jgi:hypothetical protein